MIEQESGCIVRKGERLLIEIELTKDIDIWENDATLLQSIFDEKAIADEFKVTNLFFETDARMILLRHVEQARANLDAIEAKLKNHDQLGESQIHHH